MILTKAESGSILLNLPNLPDIPDLVELLIVKKTQIHIQPYRNTAIFRNAHGEDVNTRTMEIT